MRDEKKYTERELVLAKRNAFVDGSYWGYNASQEAAAKSVGVLGAWSRADADMASESAYPFPKVTRPRVVQDEVDGYWAVVDGALRWSTFGGGTGLICVNGGFRTELLKPTPTRVAMWADLLKNPTEEVEA